MNVKLACSDATLPLLTHDRVLDLVRLLEIEAIDLGLFEGRSQLQPSHVFANTQKHAHEYNRQLQDRGLALADVFLQMDTDFSAWAINHPDGSRREKARDWFRHALDFAEQCSCPHVTTLPGVTFDNEGSTEGWGRAEAELSWRCEEAARRGIVFSAEAHVGSLAPTPTAAQRLLDAVPGLTLTLDYTHFVKQGFSQAEIDPLVAGAGHFHVRGGCVDRLQASFAANTIDYGRIVDLAREARYTGYFVLEYVWIDWEHCNEVDNLSETILWRDFFRALDSFA